MAKGIKVLGVQELQAFQRRVRRQYSLGRINRSDADFLDTHVEEMLQRIDDMQERQNNPPTLKYDEDSGERIL